MANYRPSVDDQRFLLFEVLRAGEVLGALPAFAEADEALLTQVIEEAGKFVTEVVAPLQAVGDAPGCRFEQGRVTTPPGFADAYRAFWQAGWPRWPARPKMADRACPGCWKACCTKCSAAPTTAGRWRRACCMAPTNASSTTQARN
jgi:hypothetical protein